MLQIWDKLKFNLVLFILNKETEAEMGLEINGGETKGCILTQ